MGFLRDVYLCVYYWLLQFCSLVVVPRTGEKQTAMMDANHRRHTMTETATPGILLWSDLQGLRANLARLVSPGEQATLEVLDLLGQEDLEVLRAQLVKLVCRVQWEIRVKRARLDQSVPPERMVRIAPSQPLLVGK